MLLSQHTRPPTQDKNLRSHPANLCWAGLPTFRTNSTKHRSQEGDNYRLSQFSQQPRTSLIQRIANGKNNRSFVDNETEDNPTTVVCGIVPVLPCVRLQCGLGVRVCLTQKERNSRAPKRSKKGNKTRDVEEGTGKPQQQSRRKERAATTSRVFHGCVGEPKSTQITQQRQQKQ